MSKIGVFVCHCGENIGGTVDCEKVAQEAAKIPRAASTRMCFLIVES